MLAGCFVWLKACFLLDQVALGWLGPESRPSSLPLPAEGGGLGLAVQDEAQPGNAFFIQSPVCGSQWLRPKREALGHWAPFQPLWPQ